MAEDVPETIILRPAAAAPKRRWPRFLLIGSGIFALVVLLLVVGALLYFNDDYFKAKVQAAVKDNLGRECEIEKFHVSFGGSVEISNLRIPNPDKSFKYKDTLRIGSLSAHVSLWSLIFSGFSNVDGLHIDIEKPEVNLERRGMYPIEDISSIDDIVKKLNSVPPSPTNSAATTFPLKTGLSGLNFDVAVHGGIFRCNDEDPKVGNGSIEQLEISAKQGGLGQPLQASASFSLVTPNVAAGTKNVELKAAKCTWIDARGIVDPLALKDVQFDFALNNADVPHFTKYFKDTLKDRGIHLRGPLMEGKYIWTLGAPITGGIVIEAPTLAKAKLSIRFGTNSAIYIWQAGKLAASQLAAGGEASAELGWVNGKLVQGPASARVNVGGTLEQLAKPMLEFRVDAKPPTDKGQDISVHFFSHLNDLLATDVGKVLGLYGQVGADLDGNIDATLGPSFIPVKVEGHLKAENGFVVVNGVRQPSPLDVNFSSNLINNADGTPETAQLTFSANAGSFDVTSERPVAIHSINNPQTLSADAQLNFHISGTGFWTQYGPLLRAYGLAQPVAENVAGKLIIAGRSGKVNLSLDTTMNHQSGAPAPIRLAISADYDGSAMTDAQGNIVDTPQKPCLKFSLSLASLAADQPFDVELPGAISIGKIRQIVEVPAYKISGVLSTLTQLNQRFNGYVSLLFPPQYSVAGNLQVSGKTTLVRNFNRKGELESKNLKLGMNLHIADGFIRGPGVKPGAPPLDWGEKEITLALDLERSSNDAVSKLILNNLVFASPSISLTCDMAEADFDKVAAAFSTQPFQPRLILEAVPAASVKGHISGAAIANLQNRQILTGFAADPLLTGDAGFEINHDAANHKLNIQALTFRNSYADLRKLSAQADVPALLALMDPAQANQPLTPARMLQAMPGMNIDVSLAPQCIQALQQRKFIPADLPPLGAVELKAIYNQATKKLTVGTLHVSGPALDATLTTQEMDADKLAALLSAPKINPADAAALLPSFTVDAKASNVFFDYLNSHQMLPADPRIAGSVALTARYENAGGKLVIDALKYNREAPANVPLAVLDMGKTELNALPALLAELNQPNTAASTLSNHLGVLNINLAIVQPLAIAEYLKRSGHSAPWVEDAIAGRISIKENWSVGQVVVKPLQPGALDIALNAFTPCIWYRQTPGGQLVPGASLTTGAWSILPAQSLKINLNPGMLGAQGQLVLDAAAIGCEVASPFLSNKAAQAPCRLSFNVSMANDGILRVNALDLNGGPLSFALTNFTLNTVSPKPVVGLDQLLLRAPVSGQLHGVAVDMGADTARFELDLPGIDLSKAISALPPTIKLAGTVNGLHAGYQGRLSALSSAEFNGADKLTAAFNTQDFMADARTRNGNVILRLKGGFGADLMGLASIPLVIGMDYTPAGKALIGTWGSLNLSVYAKTPGQSLQRAFTSPGLPIKVLAPATFTTPVDFLGALDAIGVLSGAAAGDPPPAPPNYDAISQLRLEMPLTTPALLLAGIRLENLNAPSLVLDQLQVTILNATAGMYGDGALKLKREVYQLPNQGHAEDFEIANINLHTVLADPAHPPKSDQYEIFGRTGGNGTLAGIGFDTPQMRSWNGNINIAINDLQLIRNGGNPSPQSKTVKILKGIGDIPFFKAHIPEQLIAAGDELTGEEFGLFVNKLEFQPLNIAITITNGVASISGSVIGKNQSAGTQFDFAGSVDLVTQTFAPDFKVWVISIPPVTQQILRLNILAEAERAAILADFQNKRFPPITITGSLAQPDANKGQLALAFTQLAFRIMTAERARAAPANAAPPPAQPANEAQPKDDPAEDILNLFIKKKKKKEDPAP